MQEFIYKFKNNKILLVMLIIIIVLLGLGAYGVIYYLKLENSQDIIYPEIEEKVVDVIMKVEIKGEILFPGVYSVNGEDRVINLIEQAGGLTENANTEMINLSKKLEDEMVVVIYSNEEINYYVDTKLKESLLIEKCLEDSNKEINACLLDTSSSSSLISLNTASIEELMNLPGIGEAKANNIINYRKENGLFSSIEEIKNVNGIGESIYTQIKDFITT